MGERSWVKEVGKQLREDLGDSPTLPEEMLDLLRKLKRQERKAARTGTAGEHTSSNQQTGRRAVQARPPR